MLRAKIEQIFMLASPFDTGNNMRSIKTQVHSLGFETVSRGHISSYNMALETGPIKRKPSNKEKDNIGWFFTLGTGNASRYMSDYYNSTLTSDTVSVKTLNERSKSNPALNIRFLNDIKR